MRYSRSSRRKIVCLLSFVIAFEMICVSEFAFAQSRKEQAIINSYIARQKRKEAATEYREARMMARGDLNNDHDGEVAVLYTLENPGGTNQYSQYLAIFTNRRGKLQPVTHRIVGGKNRRAAESVAIKDGKITLLTKEYLPTDPSCCPSKRGRVQFILSRNQLKEL